MFTFHFGGGFNDTQAVTLTNWINDTCRPDEMDTSRKAGRK